MSLSRWEAEGWLRPYLTNADEIKHLLEIVERDLTDSIQGVSTDWQFGIAYNAVLKLCTILLYAQGYRAERSRHHYLTIQAVPLILGEKHRLDAEYLEVCRKKRNVAEYDYVGGVTRGEADELVEFIKCFRRIVLKWLEENHPALSAHC